MKSYFITRPAEIYFSPIPDSVDWVLRGEGLLYYSETLDKEIKVEPNFITDLASVPRALWWLYPPSGKYDLATVLHDWLYWEQTCTFEQANDVLYESMLVCGCLPRDAAAFRFACLHGSRGAWDGYTDMNDIEKQKRFAKIICGQIIVQK